MTNLKALKSAISRPAIFRRKLYILGLLIINNEPSTYKNIKAHLLKGVVTVSPIIKNCMPKDILIKVEVLKMREILF